MLGGFGMGTAACAVAASRSEERLSEAKILGSRDDGIEHSSETGGVRGAIVRPGNGDIPDFLVHGDRAEEMGMVGGAPIASLAWGKRASRISWEGNSWCSLVIRCTPANWRNWMRGDASRRRAGALS